MLEWRTITAGNDDKRWIKGTELECAFAPGSMSRFLIYSVREYFYVDGERTADVIYRVRDAATVTLREVHDEGKRPAIVYTNRDLDAVLAWCEANK